MVTDISLLGQLLGNFRSAEWPLLGTCRAAWLLLAWLACGGMAAFAADTPYTIREKPFHAGEYDLLQDGKRLGTVRKRPFLSGEMKTVMYS